MLEKSIAIAVTELLGCKRMEPDIKLCPFSPTSNRGIRGTLWFISWPLFFQDLYKAKIVYTLINIFFS